MRRVQRAGGGGRPFRWPYNFKIGEAPVSTRLRWYPEYDAKNRLEGDAAFFTVFAPVQ